MEIAAFKVKSRNLPMLTFRHSDLNIWSYRSPIDTNSIVLNFWLKYLSRLQISAKKDVIWGRYDFSKMTTEFCKQTSFVKKRVQITSKASKLTSKFLFQQVSSSKSNLEDFMHDYFFFFRKIVIEYLNVNYLLKGGLFCKIETRVS